MSQIRNRPAALFIALAAFLLSCLSANAQTNSGKIVFADEGGRLVIINVDGTGQTFLTGGSPLLDNNPVFSPDGSKIAFNRQNGNRTDVYVMNPDGTNPVALTSNVVQPETINTSPSWSRWDETGFCKQSGWLSPA